MNIQEIITKVDDTLKRPDLTPLIESRVQSAIKEIHSRDYFPRDRYEEIIKINNIDKRVQITLPAKWRKFSVLRPMDINRIPLRLCQTEHQDFLLMDPRELFVNTIMDINIYYVAGNTFSINSEVEFPYLYVLFYRFPEVIDLNSATWITEEYYQLVIDYVLASMLAATGNKKLADVHRLLAVEQFHYFKTNNLHEGDLS